MFFNSRLLHQTLQRYVLHLKQTACIPCKMFIEGRQEKMVGIFYMQINQKVFSQADTKFCSIFTRERSNKHIV